LLDQSYLTTWNNYLTAWSSVTADERARLLENSVDEQCIYGDPAQEAHGIAELSNYMEQSQAKFPGCRFHNEQFLDHHEQGLCYWIMYDGQGATLTKGASYSRRGANGKLIQMTGFF
jgi:hypothetical protein